MVRILMRTLRGYVAVGAAIALVHRRSVRDLCGVCFGDFCDLRLQLGEHRELLFELRDLCVLPLYSAI